MANKQAVAKAQPIERWDRNDTEAHHLKDYTLLCKAQGKPPTITLMLRNGKRACGALVELGAYVYVVDLQREGGSKRVIISKHSVDAVHFGTVTNE